MQFAQFVDPLSGMALACCLDTSLLGDGQEASPVQPLYNPYIYTHIYIYQTHCVTEGTEPKGANMSCFCVCSRFWVVQPYKNRPSIAVMLRLYCFFGMMEIKMETTI